MSYYLTPNSVSLPFKDFQNYFPKNVFDDHDDDDDNDIDNYWYTKWRMTQKSYYWPYAPKIEKRFIRFEMYVLKNFLLVPVGIGEEFMMTYHIPQNVFENLESLMFLLKSYFEGDSMQVSIDFNFNHGKYKSYMQNIRTSGAYGE